MRRSGRLAIGLVLIAGGILIGLYGLFALLYNGDCGARPNCYAYVTIFGRQQNANHVGWVALAIAAVVILLGASLPRRRRSGHRES